MASPRKKKRYEGLIQFRDSLRQTLVCLKASVQSKIITSAQSEDICELDKLHEACHHLFISHQDHQTSDHSTTIETFLTARLYQAQSSKLWTEIRDHSTEVDLDIWINPHDCVATNALYQVLSKLCYGGMLNLEAAKPSLWGAYSHSCENPEQISHATTFVSAWCRSMQIPMDYALCLAGVIESTHAIFSKVESLTISSEGTYIELQLDGKFSGQTNQTSFLTKALRDLPVQAISVISQGQDSIKCYLPTRHSSSLKLQGLIIFRSLPKAESSQTA